MSPVMYHDEIRALWSSCTIYSKRLESIQASLALGFKCLHPVFLTLQQALQTMLALIKPPLSSPLPLSSFFFLSPIPMDKGKSSLNENPQDIDTLL